MTDHDKEGTRQSAGPGSGTGGEAKAAASRMSDQAKHTAQDMAGRAKEQGRNMFEQQKESAARQVDTVADAFRNTADQLQGKGQSQAGSYIGSAADRLESLGRQLREKDPEALMREAEDLGRRSPATLFAGALAAGFMFARFMKASSQRHHDSYRSSSGEFGGSSADMSRGEHDTYPLAESPVAGAAGGSATTQAAHGDVTRVPAGASGAAGTSGKTGIAGSSGTSSTSSPTSSTSGSQTLGGTHGNR